MTSEKPGRPPPPQRPPPPMSAGQICVELLPLQPHEVRWYYKEPGRFWIPFNGYDSLMLEERYQRLCRGDPGDNLSKTMLAGVLGDLYDANVLERSGTSVYWKGGDIKLLRAEWFEVGSDKWYPLEEDVAKQIEEAHRSTAWRTKFNKDVGLDARITGSPAMSGGLVARHKITVGKHDVVWFGDNDVRWFKNTDYSTKVMSFVGRKLMGKDESYGGKQLKRGYWDMARTDDRLPSIGHVVFVIHGIGQCMQGADISKSTSELREKCQKVAQKQFKDQWRGGRIEFIPVEWRTWLQLDKGLVDSLTLPNVRAIRGILNSSLLDVMYYLSPTYGPEILDGLAMRINHQYKLFMDRQPDYVRDGGLFSIAAHSLGSVIIYDILSLGKSEVCDVPMEDEGRHKLMMELQEAKARVVELEAALSKRTFKPKKLIFQLEHLFILGSPLGMFLALRDVEEHVYRHHKSAQSLLPASVCKRIHNIHHPSDPVAYRLEPLVNSAYERIHPVRIDRSGAGPSEAAQELACGPRRDSDLVEPVKKGWMSYLPSIAKGSIAASEAVANASTGSTSSDKKMLKDDSTLPLKDKLYERLDFQLQEGTMSSSYVNSFTAHTSYWTDSDVAMYLLLQLYKYQPSAPPPEYQP